MSGCDKLEKCSLPIVLIDLFLFLIITIVHFVFYFVIKETDFENIFDVFESSPLFNFRIDSNCGAYSHIIFHTWEGREEEEYYYSNGRIHSRTKIVDRTDIDKINGLYFCYKHISYRDLLYNGQIIKQNEHCEDNTKYNKDCGIIDTLNQHLCIEENENCPLYDVGIGEPENSAIYIYNDKYSDIYYNNDDYINTITDKKIIGKLILNDGQPCYRLGEKLWRKFDSDEAGDEHLKCELEIFGKLTDDRYSQKGGITYRKLYEYNLSPTNQHLIFDDLDSNLKVSLYSREFLGIDKTCDEKSSIKRKDYETLKNNQTMEKKCLLIEGILLFCFLFVPIIVMIILCCVKKGLDVNDKSFSYFIAIIFFCLLLILACLISQSVFLGRIIKSDLSYNCSDDITNEVLRKENENTKKSIIYTAANLGIDIFVFLFNILLYPIAYLIDKCDDCYISSKNLNNKTNNNKINNSAKNINNSDGIHEMLGREINVVNRRPIQENPINYGLNNNIPHPMDDLGVPPPIVQEAGSNTKI